MVRQTGFAVVVALAVVGAPGVVSAHIAMRSPAPRYGENEQKDRPCGRLGGLRTDQVAVFRPGETIDVRWDETVEHPSHYRIAFDPDGDDDLDEPVLQAESGDWVTPAGVVVLADDVPDRPGGGAYTARVTLPQIECENCTLQLIQVMYGRSAPYYYQCADLALRCETPGCTTGTPDAGGPVTGGDAGAAIDAGGDEPAGGYDGGCAVSAPGQRARSLAAAIAAMVLASVAWRRRR